MRLLCAFLLFATALAARAQEGIGPMTPPEEMKYLAGWAGKWSGEVTMSFMGPATKSKVTIAADTILNGFYFRGMHTYDMGGAKMEGMHLMTFDPADKQWHAWWYDPSAKPMHMSGPLDKANPGKVVLTSEPTEIPGVPGKSRMRASYELKGAQMPFKLEMESEGKWNTVMEGTYKKGTL